MPKAPRSKLEAALDDAIAELFPGEPVKHDKTIKVGRATMYVDRVLESKQLAIEADGRQHSQFSAHYHQDQVGFEDSKKRDSLKERFLIANGYTVIRFSHKEKITAASLRQKIIKANSEQS